MVYKRYILEGGEIVEIENEKHLNSVSGCSWFKNAVEVIEEEVEEQNNTEEEPILKKRNRKTKNK